MNSPNPLTAVDWPGIILLGLLVLACFGQVWTRGGYADDFAFLAYSNSRELLDAVLSWSETFNSRIAQGVLMPGLLQALAGDGPLDFDWTTLHAVALAAFLLTLLFLERTLALFSIPSSIRLFSLAIFALNPIKNEALLWPATIIGYILPVCLFSFAAWRYFANAQRGNESALNLAMLFALFTFGILSIEQLLPLFVVVVFLRLLLIRRPGGAWTRNVIGVLAVVATFGVVTLTGKTTDRADPFLSLAPADIPARSVEVIRDSLIDILGYAPRILLDPFYRTDVTTAATSIVFIGCVLLAMLLSVVLARRLYTEARAPWSQAALLLMSGIMIWGATLAPFMVISYYIPARALYLPSLGISLAGGAILAMMLQHVRARWFINGLLTTLFAGLALYSLINRYSEVDFSRQWAYNRALIETVAASKDQIPPGSDLCLYNVPSHFGPSPGLVNRFAVNGIVQWVQPEGNISGTTMRDFSEVMRLPASLSGHETTTFTPVATDRVLFWSPDGIHHVTGLQLTTTPPAADTPAGSGAGTDGVILTGELRPLALRAGYQDATLRVDNLIVNRRFDMGLLQITLAGEDIQEKAYRIILHATRDDGIEIPYDTTVAGRYGFRQVAEGYTRYFFVRELSRLSTLSISLNHHDRRLSRQDNGIGPHDYTPPAAQPIPAITLN